MIEVTLELIDGVVNIKASSAKYVELGEDLTSEAYNTENGINKLWNSSESTSTTVATCDTCDGYGIKGLEIKACRPPVPPGGLVSDAALNSVHDASVQPNRPSALPAAAAAAAANSVHDASLQDSTQRPVSPGDFVSDSRDVITQQLR